MGKEQDIEHTLAELVQSWFERAMYDSIASVPESLANIIRAGLIDVAVNRGCTRVEFFYKQKCVAQARVTKEGGPVQVGQLMSQNLTILCGIYQVDIEKICPGKVAGVRIERLGNIQLRITVKFKNGHEIECWDSELAGQEFKARCLMVHDLPNL